MNKIAKIYPLENTNIKSWFILNLNSDYISIQEKERQIEIATNKIIIIKSIKFWYSQSTSTLSRNLKLTNFTLVTTGYLNMVLMCWKVRVMLCVSLYLSNSGNIVHVLVTTAWIFKNKAFPVVPRREGIDGITVYPGNISLFFHKSWNGNPKIICWNGELFICIRRIYSHYLVRMI